MLATLFPRLHSRFSSLPLLGPHVEGFVVWLHSQGYPRLPIRLRVRELPRVDARLRRRGFRSLKELPKAQLVSMTPANSQDDVYFAAAIRSLVQYLGGEGLLALPRLTASEATIAAYRGHLKQTRGLAESTQVHHCATAAAFLRFIGLDRKPAALGTLTSKSIEAFVRASAPRVSRETFQHQVAHLRSLLRFLAGRGDVVRGLDTSIDTPRLYRGERLPRSLSWETVRAFLASIDRSTAMGRRDYAMFLLIATYGLRTSEVAALRLEHVEWRSRRICVPRPKTKTPLALPLTEEVGAALLDYLRRARPDLAFREVFLRVRAPAGPLAPTAVTEAFQGWSRRGQHAITFQGPHCLRHSLAVHLLRQGAPLKAIGDLLGHRSAESTCVYLRLNVEDLRDAALDLPREVQP
jgi:integrase/recombinase XerD